MDQFADHEVFELLLFFSIPQKDVNELAHRLLNTFGSLSAVMSASYEDLCRVEGIGPQSATLIRFCRELSMRYLSNLNKPDSMIMYDACELYDYLEPHFMGERVEKVYLLSFDATHRLINCSLLGSGDFDSVPLSTRNLVTQALKDNAQFAMLAHNHPNTVLRPSQSDIDATVDAAKALSTVRIVLENHVIYDNNGNFFNMYDDPQFTHVFTTRWENI